MVFCLFVVVCVMLISGQFECVFTVAHGLFDVLFGVMSMLHRMLLGALVYVWKNCPIILPGNGIMS